MIFTEGDTTHTSFRTIFSALKTIIQVRFEKAERTDVYISKKQRLGCGSFEIRMSSINIGGDITFKLFDPKFFKKTQRFYFGDSVIVNNKIPVDLHEVDFIANLFKEYKTDNMLDKKIPTKQFLIIASNKPSLLFL